MEVLSENLNPKLNTKNKFKSLAFLEVGAFEIGFVFTVLILFFGFLNYFNIISLSSLYPNQLGWLPHKDFNNIPASVNKLENFPSPISNQAHNVSAVSDVPGYILTITDRSALIFYLNTSHIWDKTFNQKTKQFTLNRITFHLADKEGDIKMLENAQGKTLSSSTFIFNNSALDLYIYLSPLALGSTNNSEIYQQTAITNTLNLGAIGTIPNATEKNPNPENAPQQNGQMFSISKK